MVWRVFDDNIHHIFFRYGLICHKNRFILLVTSIAFTLFSSIGFLWIDENTTNDPEFVFSPDNAPWRRERAILSQNWPIDEQRFWPGKSYDLKGFVDVIVAGKVVDEYGRPNILHLKYLDEVARMNDYIVHNLTIPVEVEGRMFEVSYSDLCMTFEWKCFLNDHLTMLMPKTRWGNFSADIAEFAADIITKEVNITYPIGWRGTEPIYFGALVGGPHLKDEEGHFDYAKAIRLSYNTREDKIGNVSFLWRQKLTDFLTNKVHPPSPLLDIGMFHNESLPAGLQDVADTLAPKFVGTCSILFFFCFAVSVVLMSHQNGTISIDWVRSKPLVATAGIICPLMAVVTSFGLIQWCGYWYNAIVNVSPFLVLCIGIDDLFIMAGAWHRTNPSLSPARRMADTMQEAAVAITITSVTDVASFGIGCFTPLPGVKMFCLYTCLQCLFTYIYQLWFFAPVMAYAAEMEDHGIHSFLFTQALEPSQADTKMKQHLLSGSVCRKASFPQKKPLEDPESSFPQKKPLEDPEDVAVVKAPTKTSTSRKWSEIISDAFRVLETPLDESEKHVEVVTPEETFVNKLFKEVIGPFILEKSTQVAAAVVFLVYITFAILGCMHIREGLSPKFLVRESFYLSNFYRLIDETFWNEGLQMQVVVSNPPDLSDPTERAEFSSMLRAFENTEYTMKHNATMLWLTAYERYLQEQEEEFHIEMPRNTTEWYRRCRDWVIIAGGRRLWEMDMVWGQGEDKNHLKTFRFQVGLRHYNSPVDHTNSCKLMRHIAAQFSKYNVTTFHEYYPFADQYLELKPSLMRNFIMGLLSMLVVSMIMIPDWRAAVSVVIAIASINIGVLGYMTYWGVNLDSVSVITVIMCVGFAVDLSAHIAYAYSQSYGTAHERAVEALETLGWPVFLGASSTLLGICVLTLVDAYIIIIFFKTVFLVISFSMLHGLLFLPILLMFLIPDERKRKTPPPPQVKKICDVTPNPQQIRSILKAHRSGEAKEKMKGRGNRFAEDGSISRRSRSSSATSLRQLEPIGETSEREESEVDEVVESVPHNKKTETATSSTKSEAPRAPIEGQKDTTPRSEQQDAGSTKSSIEESGNQPKIFDPK